MKGGLLEKRAQGRPSDRAPEPYTASASINTYQWTLGWGCRARGDLEGTVDNRALQYSHGFFKEEGRT